MLTVFANIKIDDPNRLKRFKKSFFSFQGANINTWVLNIRGELKQEAYEFLRKNLKSKKVFYYNLSSIKGWFADTREMCRKIKGNYIFIWNEDWVLKKKVSIFNQIIKDISQFKIDIFHYSQYHHDITKPYKILKSPETRNLYYLKFDRYLRKKYYEVIKKNNIQYAFRYIISSACIIKKNLFKKIIFKNDPPIKRWSKHTPFDFEKGPYDYHFLPMIISVPKNKIFKDIDFDRKGSSVYFDGKIYKIKKNFLLVYYIKKPIKFFLINVREIINYIISNYFLKIFSK
jgi:hypothetical protein